MAKTIIEKITDDLDGSDDATTISFGLDGVAFMIDLNAKHENELRDRLAPFVEAARRVRTGSTGGGRVPARANKDRNAAIRSWAVDNGVELPARGRIAGIVVDAYDANDVPALYAAAGLEMEQTPRRGRRAATAEFSAR